VVGAENCRYAWNRARTVNPPTIWYQAHRSWELQSTYSRASSERLCSAGVNAVKSVSLVNIVGSRSRCSNASTTIGEGNNFRR